MCFKECEQNELRGRPWVKLPRATVHFVRFYIRPCWQAREVHSADADWYWIANLPLRLLRRVIFLTSVQVHTFGPSCNTFSPVTNVDQQTTSPLTELRSELKQRIERQQSAYHGTVRRIGYNHDVLPYRQLHSTHTAKWQSCNHEVWGVQWTSLCWNWYYGDPCVYASRLRYLL